MSDTRIYLDDPNLMKQLQHISVDNLVERMQCVLTYYQIMDSYSADQFDQIFEEVLKLNKIHK